MGKLSFAVAMNLITEDFKKGTNNVKTMVAGMRKNILGLAAVFGVGGVTITSFVKSMFNAGIEMSKAEAKLKASTKSTEDYNSALGFCRQMADKYKLSVNDLVDAYSNYTATATSMGVSQKDQQMMYEALTRACKTHLASQEQTTGVIEAVSLAMRKGSVTSKQFAGAIGSTIPEATRVMGDALGVNHKQLNAMFKSGQIGIQALIKFSQQLNKEIKAPNVDTISGAFNSLHNDIVKIAESSNISAIYKKSLNGIVKIADSATNNLSSIVSAFFAIILGLTAKWAGNMVAPLIRPWLQMQATAEAAALKTESAQKSLAAKTSAYTRAMSAEKTAAARLEQVTNGGTVLQQEACQAKMQVATERRIAAEKAMIAAEAAYNKAQQDETVVVNQAAAMKSMNAFGKAFVGIKAYAISAFMGIANFLKTNWLFIVVSVVSEIVLKFHELKSEEEGIKQKWEDYNKATNAKTATSDEVVKVETLKKNIDNLKLPLSERKKYVNEINNLLGTSLSLTGDSRKENDLLNKSIGNSLKLMKTKIALAAVYNRVSQAQLDLGGAQKELEKAKGSGSMFSEFSSMFKGIFSNPIMLLINSIRSRDVRVKQNRVDELNSEIKSGNSKATGYESTVKSLMKLLKIDDKGYNFDKGVNDKKLGKEHESELQKAEDQYAKALFEAKIKHEVEKTSVQEYNKAIDELNKSTYEEVASSKNKKVSGSGFAKTLKDLATHPTYDQTQDELDKVVADYNKSLDVLKYKFDKQAISSDEFCDGMIEASKAAMDSAAHIEGIGSKADELQAYMGKLVAQTLPEFKVVNQKKYSANPNPYEVQKRDTTFDYRNMESDNMGADIDWKKELVERVNEYKKQGGIISQEIQGYIDDIIKNMPDLEKAFKMAQLKEDIKDLSKEFKQMQVERVRDLGDGFINLGQSISSISQAFGGSTKQFDKIINQVSTLWQAFNNLYDTFEKVSEIISSLTDLKKKLSAATQAETAIENASTTSKVVNAQKGAAADVAAGVISQTTAKKDIAANTGEAASEGGKSALKALPFPLNIVAAGIAIAGITLLFSKLSHFADGGIVGGGLTSGDKVLARVNSGEMILNQGQQSKLFSLLNGKSSLSTNSGVAIQSAKVRGSDLYLTLHNYLKTTGKKL